MPEERQGKYTYNGVETTYTYTVPTKEENLASLDRYPLFIATIEYFATGEGSSYYVLSCRAGDENSFRTWANENSDSYYMSGASIYKNEIPSNDRVYNYLVSERLNSILSDILSGDTESGYFNVCLKQHMNFS